MFMVYLMLCNWACLYFASYVTLRGQFIWILWGMHNPSYFTDLNDNLASTGFSNVGIIIGARYTLSLDNIQWDW